MTADAAAYIFQVPPFPGAAPHPIVRPAVLETEAERSEIRPAELIDALRQQKVGGNFWTQAPESSERSCFEADDCGALLAALHQRPVLTQGDGPFAVLSELEPGAPPTEAVLERLVDRHLFTGVSYHSPFTGEPISALQLVDILGTWRRLIDMNRPIAAAFGFARWKQDTVGGMLWGGHPAAFRSARHDQLLDIGNDATVAVWKTRVPSDFLADLESGPWRLLEVEDGFIRSAGLGADCVPPLSIVVDELGVHYDSSRPNRLETILAKGNFSAEDLQRAHMLRKWLVREGVSKYGVARAQAGLRKQPGKRHLLVVGQVEDDRSVQFGGGEVQSNLELLRRVRIAEPDAYIIYRPHPDVEAGHRRGAIPLRTALTFADTVDPDSAIGALIDLADEVHVITSLAGFEALLRGKKVTAHGTPFFVGWGLTRDLGPIPPRRHVQRTLDELVAATLLLYPRYLDPVTNLPCPAEVVILRLLAGNQRRNRALVPLRQFFGWMKRASQQILGMR